MKKYEVMYIIRPEVEEESRKALINEINEIFVSRQATNLTAKEWGLRELAYEISNCRKGYYVLLNVEASVDSINEFDRVAKIKENIIRHIVICE